MLLITLFVKLFYEIVSKHINDFFVLLVVKQIYDFQIVPWHDIQMKVEHHFLKTSEIIDPV